MSYQGSKKSSYGNQRRGKSGFRSHSNRGLEKSSLMVPGERLHGDFAKTECSAVGGSASLDARPLIYKTSIGHYGGLYVYLPEEKLGEFKAMFPKGLFPKNIEVKSVSEHWTSYGVDAWHKRFPDSDRVAVVHFANASKGEKFLEENITVPYADD